MELFEGLKKNIENKDLRIVFPESQDERILRAVARLEREKIVRPILIGSREEVLNKAKELDLDLGGIEIIDPENYDGYEDLVNSFVERRKGKASKDDAYKILKNHNYFGTMLVYKKLADGMVSGAVGSTGDTVRPALQIVKTKPGVSRISGAMIMISPEGEKYVFSDIAINITLEEDALAEVAVETAKTAKMFGIDPKVALLSFSSKGSAKSPEQEKVMNAAIKAKNMAPEFKIDGELQFDAAFVESVGAKKAPGSEVAGKANVFIFPSLEAGNIGYKIAQRLGKFEAIGPILQGLAAPISDLSRGCNEEDIYKLTIITANQAIND